MSFIHFCDGHFNSVDQNWMYSSCNVCGGLVQDKGLLQGGRGEDLREGCSHMLHFLKTAKTISGLEGEDKPR